MQICIQCSKTNPDDAKFCNSCAHPFGEPAPLAGKNAFRRWRDGLPKLRYLLLAFLLLVGVSLIGHAANLKGAQTVAEGMVDQLEALDIVSVARGAWIVLEGNMWDCGFCEKGICKPKLRMTERNLLYPERDPARPWQSLFEPPGICERNGENCSCQGFTILGTIAGLIYWPHLVVVTMWSQLDWLGFSVLTLSLVMGLAVVGRVVSDTVFGLTFLSMPLMVIAGFAFTYLLKWFLILCLMIFGYAVGLAITVGTTAAICWVVIGAALKASNLARWIQWLENRLRRN